MIAHLLMCDVEEHEEAPDAADVGVGQDAAMSKYVLRH
jgi:hypothetical protein